MWIDDKIENVGNFVKKLMVNPLLIDVRLSCINFPSMGVINCFCYVLYFVFTVNTLTTHNANV